jgi:DNA-binding LytR/AlgR family response regulator
MRISCVIVEDEPKAMNLLEEYIEKTPFLFLVAKFYNPVEAMQFLSGAEGIDLVFLDINLPEMSGIDLATIIAPEVKIVFTTAYSDFAVRSYEVNTVDYLLKPISYQRFFQAVSRTKKAMEKEKSGQKSSEPQLHFFVKSGKKIIQINWASIYYIEALKEYMAIVTDGGKTLVYKRMSEFEAIKPPNFIRIHKTFIINLDKIEKVEDNLVYIFNREIPIGKTYKEDFLSVIKDRII